MKHLIFRFRSKFYNKFNKFSNKIKNFKIKLFMLESIQSILKKLIDEDSLVVLPNNEINNINSNITKGPYKIFNQEPKGDKMTDREKLMKIEEALHKMRDNYRKIKSNKTGTLQMYTNKDVGDLVCKDLEKLFKYMEELETT